MPGRESQVLYESPLDDSRDTTDDVARESWCSRGLDAARLFFQRLAWHSIRIAADRAAPSTEILRRGCQLAQPRAMRWCWV